MSIYVSVGATKLHISVSMSSPRPKMGVKTWVMGDRADKTSVFEIELGLKSLWMR